MADTLADVLARARQDAATYRDAGDRMPPAVLARFADAVAASEDVRLLEWLSEDRARARGGFKDARPLKAKRAAWAASGLAREVRPDVWEYRTCAVARPADPGESAPSAVDRMIERSRAA